MKKLLLILLCLPFIGFGQNVNIPDANFKAYLVGNSAINTNGDSEIQVSEANAYNGHISCLNMNIADLTGIEEFTALKVLGCQNNQLTNLNVSQNTALMEISCHTNQLTSLNVNTHPDLIMLTCHNNQLTSLDVSGATALDYLECSSNQLTSLDVSQNTALRKIYCSGNELTSLDVSGATALDYLDCGGNQLTSLDLRNGNNTNFTWFNCTNNPNLTCINVDDATWSTVNWTGFPFFFDSQNYFSTNCPPTSIQEHTTNKELLKVTDLLGRETKQTNQPLFYIYDDGTVEKRIVIE